MASVRIVVCSACSLAEAECSCDWEEVTAQEPKPTYTGNGAEAPDTDTLRTMLSIVQAQQKTLDNLVAEVCRARKADSSAAIHPPDMKQTKTCGKTELPHKFDFEALLKTMPASRSGCEHKSTQQCEQKMCGGYANQHGHGVRCAECGGKLFVRLSGERVYTDPTAESVTP